MSAATLRERDLRYLQERRVLRPDDPDLLAAIRRGQAAREALKDAADDCLKAVRASWR